jgi:aspartate/methionine/tyrosine aminotransferase
MSKLTPNKDDTVRDLTLRAARLWYTYASKGILLSAGGVTSSIIPTRAFFESTPNLHTFNMYRSDRGSVFIQPNSIKQFLTEEGAISNQTDSKQLGFSFSLGCHEGIMRVARCIYDRVKNNGVFFPESCYGLLATALSMMEPWAYQVKLVGVDKKRGNKLSIQCLQTYIKSHPTSKVLIIELKTMAGAVYDDEEIKEVIGFCKQHGIFLIADATHWNMEFDRKHKMPDVAGLCQKLQFDEFVVVYTCSKTYGLERGKIAFMVFSRNIKTISQKTIDVDMYRIIGAGFDLPFELSEKLMKLPFSQRREYQQQAAVQHRINMNVMIAYIEGIHSAKIDSDLKQYLSSEIETQYHNGIDGLSVLYKPEGGIHLIIDMSQLRHHYIANIIIWNSEIFCYAVNMFAKIVTLHSYCIQDPEGFTLRLSFPFLKDIHAGMKKLSGFRVHLKEQPCENKFLPGIVIDEHTTQEELTTKFNPGCEESPRLLSKM